MEDKDPAKLTAEETIHEYDKAKRLKDEAEVLEMAEGIKNENGINEGNMAKVMVWQVKESIAHGTILRMLVATQGLFQLKTDCIEANKPKTWMVRAFGVTYGAPVTMAIFCISFFAFMFAKKQGWV